MNLKYEIKKMNNKKEKDENNDIIYSILRNVIIHLLS